MDDDTELDVPEQIELTLRRVNAAVESVWSDDKEDKSEEAKQLYLKSLEQLTDLLKRLKGGLITHECAEVELQKIQEALDEHWGDDQSALN
jgi:hypothetical protein